MKKSFTKALLALALVLISGNAWGEKVEKTATITFGKNDVIIDKALVTTIDALGNTWSIETISDYDHYKQDDRYSQVGYEKAKATSITLSTTLPKAQTIKTFSTVIGGPYKSKGTVTLKIGGNNVGTGDFKADETTTVNLTETDDEMLTGNTLTITVTDMTGGIRFYTISYSYECDPVAVESITIDKSSLSLVTGASVKLTATVLPGDSDDKTVTWYSTKEEVATVDNDGNVTAVGNGEASIIVKSNADENITATCAVSVHEKLSYATLPFSFDGGKNDIQYTDGLTQNELDDDFTTSPFLNFKNDESDYLILHINERPGKLSFDIKGVGYNKNNTFTVQTKTEEATAQWNDLVVYTTELKGDSEILTESFDLNPDVRYIKWIYTKKNNGSVALGNIKLGKYVPQEKTLTFESGKVYKTFCLGFDAIIPEGVTVYKATGEESGYITLESIEDYLPQGTGVVVKKVSDETSFTFTETLNEVSAITGNLLHGTLVATYFNTGEIYFLSSGEFIDNEAGELPANKAYLLASEIGSTGAIGLRFGDATMIKEVVAPAENVIFDLLGRKVENPTKGIYIINGKKVLVK